MSKLIDGTIYKIYSFQNSLGKKWDKEGTTT